MALLWKVIPDEQVVDPPAQHAADEWGYDRHPPPAVPGTEDFPAPAGDGREQARPEVARRVDRVAGVEAEAGADQHDQQTDDDRREAGGRRRVAAVGDPEDHRDEERGADDLIDDAAGKDA